MTAEQTKRFVLKKIEARKLTSRWTMEELDAIIERTITSELQGLWQAVRNVDPASIGTLDRVHARQLLNHVVNQHNLLTHDR